MPLMSVKICAGDPKTAPCRRGGAVAQYNAGDKGYAARVLGVKRALMREARAKGMRR